MSRNRRDKRQRRRQKRKQHKERPLKWLYDRVNGITLEGEGKPPCFLCLPPLSLKAFPWLLEQNPCCTCLGSLGCCTSNDNWARSTVLKLGAACNVLGFLGVLVATSALINNDDSMRTFGLATATLTDMGESGTSEIGNTATALEEINIYLGVRAAVLVNPNTFGSFTLPYERFCNPSLGLDAYLSTKDCAVCSDTTLSRMVAILVALVAFVPTCGMDITRAYSNFDVNCQKVASGILSLVTLAGCIVTYLQFDQCLNSFYSGPIFYDKDGQAFNPQDYPNAQFLNMDGYREVIFQWKVGFGLIGLFLAMAFKSLNFICNCCIPTPGITRNRQAQDEYEELALEEEENYEADNLYDSPW